MKRFLYAGLVAALLMGAIDSTARADGTHGARVPYFRAKPSPTTLHYEPCPRPCLPDQGPLPVAPRFYVPLPTGCYRERRDECEDKCRCKLFDKLKGGHSNHGNGCNSCK